MGSPKIEFYTSDYTSLSIDQTLEFVSHIGTFVCQPRIEASDNEDSVFFIDIEKQEHSIRYGFRPSYTLSWESVNLASYKALIRIVNHCQPTGKGKEDGGIFRYYPDEDEDFFMIAQVVDHNIQSLLLGTQDTDIRGTVSITFRSMHLLPALFSTDDYWYFCSVSEGGYSADEISYYCAVGTTYSASEPVALYSGVGAVYKMINGTKQQIANL